MIIFPIHLKADNYIDLKEVIDKEVNFTIQKEAFKEQVVNICFNFIGNYIVKVDHMVIMVDHIVMMVVVRTVSLLDHNVMVVEHIINYKIIKVVKEQIIIVEEVVTIKEHLLDAIMLDEVHFIKLIRNFELEDFEIMNYDYYF